jgi:hypothetical protein
MSIPEDPSLKLRTCFVYWPNLLAFRTIPAWDPIQKKYKDIEVRKDTEVHPLSHLAEWVRCKLCFLPEAISSEVCLLTTVRAV